MMDSNALGRAGRLLIVLAFLGVAAGAFVYFLAGTEKRVPLLESKGYAAQVTVQDVDNLVPASKVRMAGVDIGEVRETEAGDDGVVVHIAITDPAVTPLHEGVKVRVGARSLVEDNYLDITDGDGPALADGAVIPASQVEPSTQLDDVLRSLDPATRDQLGSFLRSTGRATDGTRDDLDATMTGLGALGRQGHTALDAISAQSEDLRTLTQQTQVLLEALDTGEGQIAQLVTNGDQITQATAGQSAALADTLRQLPGVLDSARTASGSVKVLATALAPVASNLDAAAPDLNTALVQLPATTADLRGLLPDLSGTLQLAGPTLERVPQLGEDVRDLVPEAQVALRDATPMLRYAQPFGPELAAFFTNFNAVLKPQDEAGIHYARLMVHVNEQSVQSPLKLAVLGSYYNPIPPVGSGSLPGPFTGPYPRVERDPK